MRQFPYHIGTVYSGPQQMGPANLLYLKPTGRKATMVCYPWDDLEQWRQVYPPGKFVQQLLLVDVQFMNAGIILRRLPTTPRVREELRMVDACRNHFRAAWSQASFIINRASLTAAGHDPKKAKEGLAAMVKRERQLAVDQFDLQREDSRLGFEATNQYYYLPIDLMEKVVNCEHLLRELAK